MDVISSSEESATIAEPPDQVNDDENDLPPDSGRNPYYCLHKNIVMRKNPLGHGLYAKAPIRAGELIYSASGSDTLATVHTDTVSAWPQEQIERFYIYAWQVDEEMWAGPSCEPDLRNDYVNYLNHSCDPTTWFTDFEVLHARRDIAVGEEITFDYCTSDTSTNMCILEGCLCGSKSCRKRVSPWDYRLPSVQSKYGNHFMPYINRRTEMEGKPTFGTGTYKQLHRGVERRESPIDGLGLFATEFIPKGALVWCDEERNHDTKENWDDVQSFSEDKKKWFLKYCWQVDNNTFVGPKSVDHIDVDMANYMNHSCNPTTWFIGDHMLEARRDIQPGEEITYDYAMADSLIERIPSCNCGSTRCRGRVTCKDYLLPELHARYEDHFVLYLLAKLEMPDARWTNPTTTEVPNEGN
eukprot:TRINITY_DN1287_c0_g1_i2.p1 TRINITY_DN1287_c0_g1~~TRINITY_DN1287_c0_g1_i2.p1  ORF type:complete len:411 (+),score=52.39 TRINITY_DN1287_c0_g1_i2:241-1473(+)